MTITNISLKRPVMNTFSSNSKAVEDKVLAKLYTKHIKYDVVSLTAIDDNDYISAVFILTANTAKYISYVSYSS